MYFTKLLRKLDRKNILGSVVLFNKIHVFSNYIHTTWFEIGCNGFFLWMINYFSRTTQILTHR